MCLKFITSFKFQELFLRKILSYRYEEEREGKGHMAFSEAESERIKILSVGNCGENKQPQVFNFGSCLKGFLELKKKITITQ